MQTTAIAMPITIGTTLPLCTSANIGYGESIAASAASFRKRALPIRSASHAATGCAHNWMIATANRQSRISDRVDADVLRRVRDHERVGEIDACNADRVGANAQQHQRATPN